MPVRSGAGGVDAADFAEMLLRKARHATHSVPDPLPPAPPGALVRAGPIAGPSVVPDSRAWAILYHSRDFDDHDVAVSGLVVAPPGAAPPQGRPVVVWAHGSVGLADRCAPCLAWAPAGDWVFFNRLGPGFAVGAYRLGRAGAVTVPVEVPGSLPPSLAAIRRE